MASKEDPAVRWEFVHPQGENIVPSVCISSILWWLYPIYALKCMLRCYSVNEIKWKYMYIYVGHKLNEMTKTLNLSQLLSMKTITEFVLFVWAVSPQYKKPYNFSVLLWDQWLDSLPRAIASFKTSCYSASVISWVSTEEFSCLFLALHTQTLASPSHCSDTSCHQHSNRLTSSFPEFSD